MFSHEWSKFESLLEMSTANFWVSFHVRPRIKCSIFYLSSFSQNPKEQSSPKFKIEKYKPSLWLSCFDKLGRPGKERARRKTFWSRVVQNPAITPGILYQADSSILCPGMKMTRWQFLLPLTAHSTFCPYQAFWPKVLFNAALSYIVFLYPIGFI